MTQRWRLLAGGALLAMTWAQSGVGQDSMPPVALKIDVENFVRYDYDTGDWSKYATVSGRATPLPFPIPPFGPEIIVGDVVAVNGRPTKGVRLFRGLAINFARDAAPKQAIADLSGSPYVDQLFVFQNLDGTVIGTFATIGLQITDPAPARNGLSGWGSVVTGGSGAFLGVTGQGCGAGGGGTPPGGARRSSVAEDPANRRTNGGGSTYSVFCLIPRTRPAVFVTANGPAVAHAADFSPVTSAKPAKPGELLSLVAQPFTADPLQLVNSPNRGDH